MSSQNNPLLQIGDSFGKYRVERELGHGGMGAVYLVRHTVIDSFFALKVLYPDVAGRDKKFVDRFIREAMLSGQIRHPNLIAVYDAGLNEANGMYYLVMDYVAGGTLRHRLKKEGRIQAAEAISITRQVASALDMARRHGMVTATSSRTISCSTTTASCASPISASPRRPETRTQT